MKLVIQDNQTELKDTFEEIKAHFSQVSLV